jgi:hypothetical protein
MSFLKGFITNGLVLFENQQKTAKNAPADYSML